MIELALIGEKQGNILPGKNTQMSSLKFFGGPNHSWKLMARRRRGRMKTAAGREPGIETGLRIPAAIVECRFQAGQAR